jgi:hypothetical protein
MSEKFHDDEARRILGEAARLSVERADQRSPFSGHSFEDLSAAAAESGIDGDALLDALQRAGGRVLFVKDSTGASRVRRLGWKEGEPGKWRKYACPVQGCGLRETCHIARWEHIVESCEEVLALKPTLGVVTASPSGEGPLARTSPNGRYALFLAGAGDATRDLFSKIYREQGIHCGYALGAVDLRHHKAGLLLAGRSSFVPRWTGPATFRIELSSDFVLVTQKGRSTRLLAKLPDRDSQIFFHLGEDPARLVLTRVDAYRIEG